MATQDNEELRVRIYDGDSQAVSTIPARELALGFMRVVVDGVGECWIDSSKVKQGSIKQGEFDEETRSAIGQIKASVDNVFFRTFDEWEDDFRRDRYPHQEIAIWMRIANAYTQLTEGKTLDEQERLDIFKLLLGCAGNPRETVLLVAGLEKLSRPEAEAVIRVFYGEA